RGASGVRRRRGRAPLRRLREPRAPRRLQAPRLVPPLEQVTLGGLNRSSQHLVMEVVRDGWWQASGGDSCDARADLVAGAAVGCAARGPRPLLGSDRPWSVE